MNHRILILALLVFTPIVTSAQTIQSLLFSFAVFISGTLVPLVFALAFFFFIYNTARYFILDAAKETERTKAKQFALWSIIAFVLMLSIWGIINLLVRDFGFMQSNPICPDYMQGC